MKKTARLCVVTGLALVFACGTALADTQKLNKRKKQSFFESLFGTPSKSRVDRKKRRNMFGTGRNDRNWWKDDDDGVRIISGQSGNRPKKNRNVIVADDDDPERGIPGLGMGNLPYVAAKLVPLGGLKFSESRPAETASGHVYDTLTAPGPALRIMPEIRDALSDQYRQQNFRPLWLDQSGKLSPRAVAVVKLLAAADEEGLESASYLPPSLASFDSIPPESDAAAMAKLDVEITALALKYARDASGGQFDPRHLSLYHDVTPAWVASSKAVKVIAWSPYPAEYLQGLHPELPAYAAMKAELAKLRKDETVVTHDPIPDGAIVKKGKSDERIPAIRQRLADLGYPEALNAASDPLVLDADLSVQLRLFQKASAIKTTGVLGPQTVAALNANTSGRDIARLLNNMERARWLPKSLGLRHVFVNQAAFEARVMDKGEEVWKTRVIVGKAHTQTNVFHDEMETVVFNPSWGVPPSIIANEYLPKLRRDPGYLDRIGYKVVNEKGKVVPSRSVAWGKYGSKVPFGIQQPPGAKNALGDVKFLFPNTHNIYMHDTPSRELFENDVRAFSHGCVRVQDPRHFASVILGWDRTQVEEHIATAKTETVKLPTKVPVHLTYFTAWPDNAGKMQYFSDIYGRDKAMENARSAIVVAQR
jgi:murein L,D-transpeptidase YcbB/YkuD